MNDEEILLNFIKSNNGTTTKVIKEKLGFSDSKISKLSSRLETKKLIIKKSYQLNIPSRKGHRKRFYLWEIDSHQELNEKLEFLEAKINQLSDINNDLMKENLRLQKQLSIESPLISNVLAKVFDLSTINCIHGLAKKLQINLDSRKGKENLIKSIITKVLEQEIPHF